MKKTYLTYIIIGAIKALSNEMFSLGSWTLSKRPLWAKTLLRDIGSNLRILGYMVNQAFGYISTWNNNYNLLTREKPLEWTPLDGRPMSTSPAKMFFPLITESFLTIPIAKPLRSYSVAA